VLEKKIKEARRAIKEYCLTSTIEKQKGHVGEVLGEIEFLIAISDSKLNFEEASFCKHHLESLKNYLEKRYVKKITSGKESKPFTSFGFRYTL
jgi:deoxyxylulose-5-phosphate synthase